MGDEPKTVGDALRDAQAIMLQNLLTSFGEDPERAKRLGDDLRDPNSNRKAAETLKGMGVDPDGYVTSPPREEVPKPRTVDGDLKGLRAFLSEQARPKPRR